MVPSACSSFGDTSGRTASVDTYCHQRTGLLAALLSDFLITSKGKPVAWPVSPSATPGIISKPGFPGRTLKLCFWRRKRNCRRLIKKREKQLKRDTGSHTACHNLYLSPLAAGLSAKLLVQQLEIAFLKASWAPAVSRWRGAAKARALWGGWSLPGGRAARITLAPKKWWILAHADQGQQEPLKHCLPSRWWTCHWEMKAGSAAQKGAYLVFHASARTDTARNLHGSAVFTL